MKVHIFEKGFGKRHPYKKLREALFKPYWFPLDNAAPELRAMGHSVTFWDRPDKAMYDCDVLILSGRSVDQLCADPAYPCSSRAEFCNGARRPGQRLIWFDSRDSAGNCQFDVMPFVDLYLKRQLYRDRSVYAKPLYGGRVFSNYYHENYDIDDAADWEDIAAGTGDAFTPFKPEEIAADIGQTDKMRVAWGCGAEFHWPLFSQPQAQFRYFSRQFLHRYLPSIAAAPDTVSPQASRPVDVCALFDHKRYSVASVGYQRRLGLERAQQLPSANKVTGRVPREAFYDTLSKSAVTMSVFGWGEVCFREYEATYCGSAILMADMSGIETYPDFYQAGTYYVPFAWDFSDLEEKYRWLMDNPDERVAMAERAQAFLIAQWSRDGREEFAKRFVDLISSDTGN